MRRLVAVMMTVLAFCAVAPRAAAHNPPERVVIVTVDGTDLEDWRRANVPEIDLLFAAGAAGLMSSRTALPVPRTVDECLGRGQAAVRTMLEGRPSRGGEFEERNTALSRRLSEHGVFVGIGRGTVSDAAFPGGARANIPLFIRALNRAPSVAIFPLIDTLAADCRTSGAERDRWVDLGLRRAGALITAARRAADHVIVASTLPPVRAERAGNMLSVIVLAGPVPVGGLQSQTTRRPGVVTLQDVAATVLNIYKSGTQLGDSSVMRSYKGSVRLDGRAKRYSHAAALRRPLVAGFCIAAATLFVLAFLLIVAGRPARVLRACVGFGLRATMMVPAACLLIGFAPANTAVTALLVASISMAATVSGIFLRRAALTIAAALTLAVATLDGFLNGGLSSLGVLSSHVARGTRFYGLDGVTLGALVAGALIWGAAMLDMAPRRAVHFVAGILGMTVAVALLPLFGNRVALPLATVIAFAYFSLNPDQVQIERTTLLQLAIATVFAAGLIAGSGRVPDAESVSDAGGIIWLLPPATLFFIAVVLGAKRPALLARGFWGRPHLRMALAGCALACVAALGTDKAGLVTAATIAVIAGAAFLSTLLLGGGPDRTAYLPRARPSVLLARR